METKDVVVSICEIISDILVGVPVKEDTEFEKLSFDSFDQIELIMKLEEEYKIDLSGKENVPKTVKELADLVMDELSNQATKEVN